MKQLLYVPYLRRESAPQALPSDVLFMDCGMNASQGAAYSSGADNGPAEQGTLWTSPRLPFAPNEAKHVLNDLLQFGHNVGTYGGDIQALAAGMAETNRNAARKSTSRHELRELELFEQDGLAGDELALLGDQEQSVAERQALAEAEALQTETERLQSAQKTLLLAWHLEGSALELDALRDSFTAGRELLMDTIGVEEDELSELMGFAGMGGLPSRDKGANGKSSGLLSQNGIGSLPDQDPFTADLAGSGLDVLRPSWRSLLENMLPFMPDDAALITCDVAMVEAMQEFGVHFEPVSSAGMGELAKNLQVKLEGFDGTTCKSTTGPMWQLLGYKAAVANKPWLDRVLTLYAVVYA